MTQDVSSFLLGGSSAPALKFPSPGTAHTLTITEPPELRDQTDFQTGEVLVWKDGNPRKQLVVTGTAENFEPEGDEDDGSRRLYVKGQMQKAVGEAVRQAGERDLKPGGKLWVQYTGDGQAERGKNPPKQYTARYKAPDGDAASFLGTGGDSSGGLRSPGGKVAADSAPPF